MESADKGRRETKWPTAIPFSAWERQGDREKGNLTGARGMGTDSKADSKESQFPYPSSTSWSTFCTSHLFCCCSLTRSMNPERYLKPDEQFVFGHWGENLKSNDGDSHLFRRTIKQAWAVVLLPSRSSRLWSHHPVVLLHCSFKKHV